MRKRRNGTGGNGEWLLYSRYFGGARMRERRKEGKGGGLRERQGEGGKRGDGWGVKVLDGFLICACVRVERGRQEENKTQRGRERAA